MFVSAPCEQLEKYLESLEYSGETIEVKKDTVPTFDINTYVEKVMVRIYSFPKEIQFLINAARSYEIDIIIDAANKVMKRKTK